MARYFVEMDDGEALKNFASATLLAGDRLEVGGAAAYLSKADPRLLIADLQEDDVAALLDSGATVFPDVELDLFDETGAADRWEARRFWETTPAVDFAAPPIGLPEVLDQIQAPQAWELSRGEGVTIAVVDTGVCGSLRELPPIKRSPIDLPSAYAGTHWSDTVGHGSMCATIAAGTVAAGGRFNGVAPDATVLAARTTLFSTDIYRIYDGLRAAKKTGEIPGPLVVTNSYGSYVCSPPAGLPENHPYLRMILGAISEGITVVFAAGNNHFDVLCNHDPTKCSPNSIWGPNSHDKVLSVGTVNAAGSNQDPITPHANSSRGPGQWSDVHPKPDCVAPTYGEVVWGCGYRTMPWWGTSGACPQVAGLAALLLARAPHLTPADVGDVIRSTCVGLPGGSHCVGAGLIDCAAAVAGV
jgi:subtilisin family serine protease